MRSDLHIHTTASDGRWTPEETVVAVQREGIECFAITDHETVANVHETAALAQQAGLAFLAGVEMSAGYDGVILHILGYGVDADDRALHQLLEHNTGCMRWTNEEIMRRLIATGAPLDLGEYAAYRNDRSRGGWSALNYMIDKGICRDARDFFDRVYVPPIQPPAPDFAQLDEVVRIVRAAGGLPVLAHPGSSLRERGVSEETMAPILESGVAGVECYSYHHDEEVTRVCLDVCDRWGCLITGGSDCHGGFVGRPLGIPRIDLADLRLGELMEHVLHPA